MVQKLKYPALIIAAYLIAAVADYALTFSRQLKLPSASHSSAELSPEMRQLMHQHQLTGAALAQLITDAEQQKQQYKN
ncbi:MULTISPECIES: hypothetical protein [Rheinheimera]|uniref:Uncharacterized protein n=1 Tax=Rheinheimera marina TaxID=1774958 RepID=A0ABV9JKC3_9GAMM